MNGWINHEKIKELAAAGKTDIEIAAELGCRIETLRTIARRKHLTILGYNPKGRGGADVKYLPTDEEIDQKCHELAVGMGIVRPVTTRQATEEERMIYGIGGIR